MNFKLLKYWNMKFQVLKLGDFGCSIKFKDPIGPIASQARATGFMGTFRNYILEKCLLIGYLIVFC